MREVRETKRYLGLELAGAKNHKTAVAALEFYPRERKIFLLDLYERIGNDERTSDESLLELFEELKPRIAKIGVNVALDLPPCIECTRKTCPLPAKCSVPAVKWMRETTKKAARSSTGIRVREFTPYTQRPSELWVRYQVLPKLPEPFRFEIDETLGGNKAPLTARMNFLKRHLREFPLVEVWPKLAVSSLALELGMNKRIIAAYRHLEEGVHAREKILEELAHHHGIFIYERDIRKLAHSLTTFDAFICAYTALLSDLEKCATAPHSFPNTSTWVQYPNVSLRD